MAWEYKQILRLIWLFLNFIRLLNISLKCSYYTQARIQRGGDLGSEPPPPPSDLSEVVSCVVAWCVGERVQQLFLPYYYQFFLDYFARQYYRKSITWHCIHTSKFNVQYRTVILSLYFPYPNYENNPTCHPLLLWKGISDFSCLELHDFTTFKTEFFSGGGPKDPPPRHMNNIKTTMSSVYLCMPYRNKFSLYV